MAVSHDVVVFLGPSLPRDRARELLSGVAFHGPIARRDLPEVIAGGARVVAIIDGVFHQSLAVSPKEIRQALGSGVTVFGAASMGALRACELHAYGMIGVGTIYQWYRRGQIVADDEVAIVFHPETYDSLSVPMVNVRYALRCAVAQGVLDDVSAAVILKAARSFHYTDLTYPALVDRVPDRTLPAGWSRSALSSFLGRFDLKREDAIACLTAVHGFLERPPVTAP